MVLAFGAPAASTALAPYQFGLQASLVGRRGSSHSWLGDSESCSDTIRTGPPCRHSTASSLGFESRGNLEPVNRSYIAIPA